MKCTKCGSPMKLASFSRGYQTYCCCKGCSDSYQFTYNEKPEAKNDEKRPANNVPVLQSQLAF